LYEKRHELRITRALFLVSLGACPPSPQKLTYTVRFRGLAMWRLPSADWLIGNTG